ncbi:hypothetical protein O6H91_05G073600 [Diphasiastrum complanatum]|uniref:Uncharacterized protein n=1 Tax=Diphasiastrum complanatum TaxID=34168 RepID=A0ACC2DPS8_DIPCM|nr:hypothetical protein O6H91_05G073600 [Diphasiastrum complanatum]
MLVINLKQFTVLSNLFLWVQKGDSWKGRLIVMETSVVDSRIDRRLSKQPIPFSSCPANPFPNLHAILLGRAVKNQLWIKLLGAEWDQWWNCRLWIDEANLCYGQRILWPCVRAASCFLMVEWIMDEPLC